MRFHYEAKVTVYSQDDTYSERRTIQDYIEADSKLAATTHAPTVIRDITAEWGGDEIDWPVQRTEIHSIRWTPERDNHG